ncbi:hypothetical protein BDZ94DRAFT_923597 [Collybia nuda]|uniref:Uncharacterized protein n=1 Tax=Collybia nuda TaxID=64659 RepID=A0A9P5XZF8_9AGAR|nr:hypothetical protein BDZ94DRAFT_923597 [Collybia nuda]
MTGGYQPHESFSRDSFSSYPLNESGLGGRPNVAFRTDPSGWYTPIIAGETSGQPQYSSHPHGPHHQPSSSPLAVYASPPESISPHISFDSSNIHDFWRGRLAPLPGFTSRPGLAATATNSRAIKISIPTTNHEKPQLLSPKSLPSPGGSDRQKILTNNLPLTVKKHEIITPDKDQAAFPIR